MSDAVRSGYAAGLAMLARRELSEAQIRERLRRKEFEPDVIEAAVTRLREVRAVDDRRVAVSVARTESQIRSRGRGYVLRRLQSIGIGPELAKEVVDEVFGALDETALLERALTRRMRGRNARVQDQAQFRRLLNQLIRQGFPPSAVIAALKARARRDAVTDDDPDTD
jgi:regulatory protein